MKLCAFLLLCVVAPLNTVWATNYCDPKLCSGLGPHIGCQASHNFGPRCTPDAEILHFTPERINLVVGEINNIRNLIAGGGDQRHLPACRMTTILWDQELAQLAEWNAKQCFFNHDQCRNTDYFKSAGQNLAWMEYQHPLNFENELIAAIKKWEGHSIYSDMTNIRKFSNDFRLSNHFTLLINDKNNRVGCGASTFTKLNSPVKNILLVCNFATENILRYPVYKDCPTPAMECTSGTSPYYPNLCSNAEQIQYFLKYV